MWDHMYEYGGGGGWMWFGGLAMVLFWILVILAIIALARWLFSGGGAAGGDRDPALDLLRERFARGEIDHDEFEEKKRLLKK
ncbi:MAG TPA: SHOCT domain-containing protein [Gammaproteobacteria bacterium]|nr:SHOCT domain-containing protein [Gammaproteobacteria bacterium]